MLKRCRVAILLAVAVGLQFLPIISFASEGSPNSKQVVLIIVEQSYENLKVRLPFEDEAKQLLQLAGMKGVVDVKDGVSVATLRISCKGKLVGKNPYVSRGIDGRLYKTVKSIQISLDGEITLNLNSSPISKKFAISEEKFGHRIWVDLAFKNLFKESFPGALIEVIYESQGHNFLIAVLQYRRYQSQAEALLLKQGIRSLGPVTNALTNPDENIRESATRILGLLGYKSSIDVLLTALTDSSREVRSAAINSLDSIDSDWRKLAQTTQIVDKLLVQLKYVTKANVEMITSTLACIGDVRAIPAFITLMKSNDEAHRLHAANGLGKFGIAGVEGLLMGLRDKSPKVRAYTVEAMDCLADDSVMPYLLSALKDSSEKVRFQAVLKFYKCKGNQDIVVPALIDALKDPYCSVRSVAAQVLGKMKNRDAVLPLINALSNEDVSLVKDNMVKALQELTGQQFQSDVQKWREWFEANKNL